MKGTLDQQNDSTQEKRFHKEEKTSQKSSYKFEKL